MLTRRVATTMFGALALGLFLAAPTHGSANALHTNMLTFGAPVRLPGVTLAAGSYIFERVVATNRDIVVVRSGDRTSVYFMGTTQPIERPDGLDRNRAVTFGESRPGSTPPITAWYPVGERMGHAFIYASR
jgi:hypothetical protein